MPEKRERALFELGRLLAEGSSIIAAALIQLLHPERLGHLVDPVVHRPRRYGSTNLPHAERVLAARLAREELREGKGIEVIRLLGREHDGAVRARTITCDLEALHMLTKVWGHRTGPERREGPDSTRRGRRQLVTSSSERAVKGQRGQHRNRRG
jgi:hypothetical protein